MPKIDHLTIECVDFMPDIEDMQEGILYYCPQFELGIHLCACGCGQKTVTPFRPDQWNLTIWDEKATIRPSIGNFTGENPYHAHYFITAGRVEWC